MDYLLFLLQQFQIYVLEFFKSIIEPFNKIYVNEFLMWFIIVLIACILIIVPMLITVAYYTIAERKVMAAIQRRKGPTNVGFWGLLQPLADGFKLLIKETIYPRKANLEVFIFSPMFSFILSLLNWLVIPFNFGNCFIDLNYGILYLFVISGFGVYGVILAGWSSNSKYALLGAIRAAAQMISYEISISLSIIPILLIGGSLNLIDIIYQQSESGIYFFPLAPSAIIFFISILAETNRAPFDLAESEAEIVAGYNLDYSAIIFAMFFLAEYSNMIIMSALMVIFFFGGWYLPIISYFFWYLNEIIFIVKTVFFCFLFIVMRSILPRYRYDQLMDLGWKIFLPLTLGFFIFYSSFLFGLNILPIKQIPLFYY
jgi:NADH-quinone oxidoreductase subunit H